MRSFSRSYQLILKSFLLSVFCFFLHTVSGQISHGGKPLPLYADAGARALAPSAEGLFVEMPSFDVQAALRNAENDQARFKSLEFAHKFHTFLRPDNSGISFVSDNMNVWRVGVRSKGAYSLNILFSKFRLPPGAKLFLYNSDQTEILGSYTEKNNTELNLLPTQPIGGEDIIVEYQEPLDALFKGEIEVGEVNHDFLGLFRSGEPRDPSQDCHPNLLCYPEDIEPGSGVVGLIINGGTYCTGFLVNNTANDATPYLLTATHCLNQNYNASFIRNRKYDIMAGSIVAFFNYNSPLCNIDIRGPLQMTMASADSVLISERHDISLLKLKELPPAEYQPYYLGWYAGSSPSAPFHGVHHPNGGIKKVAVSDGTVSLASFTLPNNTVSEPNSFWEVKAWETGGTEGGSSGSPLLDRRGRALGTLTGGSSHCGSLRGPDSYGSLYKFWNVQGSLNNPNPISYYLDPSGSQVTQTNGFNLYSQQPYTKSHNFKTDDVAVKTTSQEVPLFETNNTFGYTEFAEQFNAGSEVQLRGVFVSSPKHTNGISGMNISIKVYTGENGPERLLHNQDYNYSYRYYSNGGFTDGSRTMSYNVENYIRFTNPVTVSGLFYISYSDLNGASPGFSVFNAEPRTIGSGYAPTAWIKNGATWVKSSGDIEKPINTALLIAPYIIGTLSTTVDPEKNQPNVSIKYSKEEKRIVIESNYDITEWEIFYSSGIKIHHQTFNDAQTLGSYPSAHLLKGVYIVRVKTIDGKVTSKKVAVL